MGGEDITIALTLKSQTEKNYILFEFFSLSIFWCVDGSDVCEKTRFSSQRFLLFWIQ